MEPSITCEKCQGNGEVVIDWDRYLHPRDGDVGDEAVSECQDCCGTGYADYADQIDHEEVMTAEAAARAIKGGRHD